MNEHPIKGNSSDRITVTVEQADTLFRMIASDENARRISSTAPSNGLVLLGLAGANGLTGDVARTLKSVRAARIQIVTRVVFSNMRGVACDWGVWPAVSCSVVMRSGMDGVHFDQVDYCEVPHILASASLLHAGSTIYGGSPYIPADFIVVIRSLDAQGVQDVLNDLVTYGSAESHFAQDYVLGCWSAVTRVRERIHRYEWKTGLYYECFMTDHLHAQIHAPSDEETLAYLSVDPILDVPPRAAIWMMLMGMLTPWRSLRGRGLERGRGRFQRQRASQQA